MAFQEVVRVVLVDAQNRCITKVDISQGTVNQSLAHPREIFRPVIIHSASAFALIHNHPSGAAVASKRDNLLTKRVVAAAQILQITFLDHVIVGQPMAADVVSSVSGKQDFCKTPCVVRSDGIAAACWPTQEAARR
jgi:DNA repair protein RadC